METGGEYSRSHGATPAKPGIGYLSQAEAYEAPRTRKRANSRIANLGHAVFNVVAGAADGVVGALEIVPGIFSNNYHGSANQHLSNFGRLPASVFIKLLRVINPDAQLSMYRDQTRYDGVREGCGLDNYHCLAGKKEFDGEKKAEHENTAVAANGDGLLVNKVTNGFIKVATPLCGSFLGREVFGRALYAMTFVGLALARSIDTVAGVGAGSLSFLTAGKVTVLNNIAYRGLGSPGRILEDLNKHIRGVIWGLPRLD